MIITKEEKKFMKKDIETKQRPMKASRRKVKNKTKTKITVLCRKRNNSILLFLTRNPTVKEIQKNINCIK